MMRLNRQNILILLVFLMALQACEKANAPASSPEGSNRRFELSEEPEFEDTDPLDDNSELEDESDEIKDDQDIENDNDVSNRSEGDSQVHQQSETATEGNAGGSLTDLSNLNLDANASGTKNTGGADHQEETTTKKGGNNGGTATENEGGSGNLETLGNLDRSSGSSNGGGAKPRSTKGGLKPNPESTPRNDTKIKDPKAEEEKTVRESQDFKDLSSWVFDGSSVNNDYSFTDHSLEYEIKKAVIDQKPNIESRDYEKIKRRKIDFRLDFIPKKIAEIVEPKMDSAGGVASVFVMSFRKQIREAIEALPSTSANHIVMVLPPDKIHSKAMGDLLSLVLDSMDEDDKGKVDRVSKARDFLQNRGATIVGGMINGRIKGVRNGALEAAKKNPRLIYLDLNDYVIVKRGGDQKSFEDYGVVNPADRQFYSIAELYDQQNAESAQVILNNVMLSYLNTKLGFKVPYQD